MRGSACSCALLFLHCGGTDVVFRPVEIDVQGLSPRAETLVVGWMAGDEICGEVEASSVRSLTLTSSARWEAGETPRRLSLPEAEVSQGLVIAYSEAGGDVLQVGCAAVAYEDVERPSLALVLSAP